MTEPLRHERDVGTAAEQQRRVLGGGGIGGLRWWPNPIILVAFSVPFFYIDDREGTSSTFIVDRVGGTTARLGDRF